MSKHDTRRRAYAALSLLLQYPEVDSVRVVPQLRDAIREMSADEQADFEAFLGWLEGASLLEAQAHYVELFDRKRRACLYLSYYLNGDTRRRGMALVDFKDLFRNGGWKASDAELPDFLPTVLQFCAVADTEAGERVLSMHRGGLRCCASPCTMHARRTRRWRGPCCDSFPTPVRRGPRPSTSSPPARPPRWWASNPFPQPRP